MNLVLKSNKPLVSLFLISILLILLAGISLLFFWNKMPPELPWFYSLPWGEAQLIPKAGFLVGLIALIVVNILNGVLSYFFSKKDRVVANVVMAANILITLLYLTSFYKVLSVVVY
ncbi:hypothetical protein HYS10_01270 [Candidatus Collierbacteria bacterium]|nr:hypothetical protein [Candidatus Collierbacteria bacterium]